MGGVLVGRTQPEKEGETDDADVIAGVIAGDRDLFRVLVARYGVLAKRTAVLYGAADDADDVVQEAFVAAYRALPRFRTGEPFRPWLLRIVVNRSRNVVRARNRAQTLADRMATWHHGVMEGDPSLEALSSERRDALVRALGDLRPPDREILVVRFLLDLSEADAARMLKLPKGTVKSRTARALQRLRVTLVELNVEAGIGYG
jgi:RNA polymerase sigma factor (sigma-70 family)